MSEFWKSLLERFTPKSDEPLVPLLYPELREPQLIAVYRERARIPGVKLEVRVSFKEE